MIENRSGSVIVRQCLPVPTSGPPARNRVAGNLAAVSNSDRISDFSAAAGAISACFSAPS